MKRILLLLALFGRLLHASAMYQFVADTSSIRGTTANLDFQFNPGGSDADPANASVISLLPGADFTLTNSLALNEQTEAVVLGNTLSFVLKLSGAAVDSPNPLATAGTTFGFSIFDESFIHPLLTSDPNGFLFTLDIFPHNVRTATIFGAVNVTEVAVDTPEPSAAALLGIGLFLLMSLSHVARYKSEVIGGHRAGSGHAV